MAKRGREGIADVEGGRSTEPERGEGNGALAARGCPIP